MKGANPRGSGVGTLQIGSKMCPLVRFSNEYSLGVKTVPAKCLLDTGFMVSTVSESFYREHLQHVPNEDINYLIVYGPDDTILPD